MHQQVWPVDGSKKKRASEALIRHVLSTVDAARYTIIVMYVCMYMYVCKAQKRYISPIGPKVPSEWICTKFGLGGPVADTINSDNSCCNRFRGFWFCSRGGGQSSPFPIEWPVAVNTVLALHAACDSSETKWKFKLITQVDWGCTQNLKKILWFWGVNGLSGRVTALHHALQTALHQTHFTQIFRYGMV